MELLLSVSKEPAAVEMKETEKVILQLLRITYLWALAASGVLRVSPFVWARASSRRGTISQENKCDTRSFSPNRARGFAPQP